MLPPVEEAVLQNNPDFAALHNSLTAAVLNPSGSTKNDPAAKERTAVREELKTYRLKAAKQHLLAQAISAATPPETRPQRRRPKAPSRAEDGELPPELLDLLLLLSPLLTSPQTLTPESTTLLLSNPPFSLLPTLLPQLTALVSANLQSSALSLARIANPTTNSSYVHRSIPSLPAHITTRHETLATQKAAVTRARLGAATSLILLLAQHTEALAALVRSLEVKHSTVSRSLELRAAEIAQTGQRVEIDAQSVLADARTAVYTPEASAALRNYDAHLRDAKMRLAESIRTAAAELEAYGVSLEGGGGGGGDEGKERTMREMARVYHDMGRQMGDVKGDLDRLGTAR